MMVTATSAMRMKVNVDSVDDDLGGDGVGGVDVMLDVFIIMRRGTIVDGGEDVVGSFERIKLCSRMCCGISE